MIINNFFRVKNKRVNTPTVIQMEAVECGAAALGIVLGYFGKILPLEELRIETGVSRDGSSAFNMIKAARKYGLVAMAYKKEPEDLIDMPLPFIVHWNFNHFVVVEGFSKNRVYLNDPACGQRTVSYEEFDQSFTGIVILLSPGPEFKPGIKKRSMLDALKSRFIGYKTALVYVVLAGLLLVIPGLIIPNFIRVLVDEVIVAGRHNWIIPLLIVMTITMIIQVLIMWLQKKYLLRMHTHLALFQSSKFLWHLFRLPIQFFQQRYAGDIANRVMINDKVASVLSGNLATTVISLFMVVFYAVLLFSYNVKLTLIGICMAGLNILVLKSSSRPRNDGNQKVLMEDGKLFGVSVNGLQSIETLKATGCELDFFAKWAGHQAKAINAREKLAALNISIFSLPPALFSLNSAIMLTLGSFEVMNGRMTIGMLMAFQSLMSNFFTPFYDIVNMGATIQELEGNMNRLDDVLNYKVEENLDLKPDVNFQTFSKDNVKLTGLMEVRNITFGYSPLAEPLIKNFSLTLKPGHRIALVGPSGSGKSTIAKLVTGLYRPWSGDILFDGLPLEKIPRRIFTNSVALVDQDIILFEGSIKENLSLWDSTMPSENLLAAGKDASIHNDIASRPGGYDSKVTEMGTNFSNGQRQRLEIARALVNNPSILIFDEATSALDAITEKEIDDNLRRRGISCLIIAHRISTIRDCDEIIVLEKGEVVERGTHQELYKRGGYYTRLIKTTLDSTDVTETQIDL